VTTAALILGALLALAAVVVVARPFLRDPALPPEADRLDEPGPLGQRQLVLAEERDRALAALKELEFDHRTGKVSDEDYRELVGPLRRAAAEALLALEPRAKRLPFPLMSESPTVVPEPTPVPHEPLQPPDIPEPYPPPSPPPQPTPVPEPTPVPHEPPQPQASPDTS
jgi:hypothetical protein